MAEYIQLSNDMLRVTQEGLLLSANNPEALETWIKHCNTNLRLLGRAVKTNSLNMGAKRNIESTMGKLKGLRVQMKASQRVGMGAQLQQKEKQSDRIRWENINSAFRSRVRTGVVINLLHVDPLTFLEDALHMFKRRIKKALNEYPSLKVNVDFCGEFVKEAGNTVVYQSKHFTTKNEPIYATTNIKEWWECHVQDSIITQIENFVEMGSGWRLSSVVNLAVNINHYEPLRGSSYIPLPKEIQKKHACINVQNTDNKCFAWAVVSALYPASRNHQRPSKYPDPASVLNLEGIRFPMNLRQVRKFEKQNQISINIFVLERYANAYHGYKVLPAHLTKKELDRHVNLLMIQDTYDEVVENIKYHYVWIKSLSSLVSKQVSAHNGKKHICSRCLHFFNTAEKLQKHTVDCSEVNEYKIKMPWKEDEKIVKFKNIRNQIQVPFIIYADFESMLKPINKQKGLKTELYQEHEAYSIGYYLKCHYDDSLSYYRSYSGTDCSKWFMRELKQVVENVEPVYWAPQPMQLTTQQEQDFKDATHCHICKKVFTEDDVIVRDHNHLTSEYRGAAHNECNLNFQDKKIIPVVFHNLSGYDSHFLIRDLAREIEGRISLLPVNKEQYISFTKYIEPGDIKLRFIDSFRFMADSLDTLASNLDELKIVRKEFPELSNEKFKLLTRKGVFPYEYVTSWDRLSEPQLPSMPNFESKLSTAELDEVEPEHRQKILQQRQASLEKNYTHACKVWSEFNCSTLLEYSELYMKLDVLLLADVFENFRKTCFTTYGLDAAHYVSAPGLTWDAMLKYTGVNLELLTDVDQLLFVERGIRGGLSQCSHRYAKANNQYAPDYDTSEPTNYLMYYDVNNLYGWAMSEYLPTGGFRWCDTPIDVTSIPDNSPVGYMFEVDLEYPQEIHDIHQDLPFCPQKMIPPRGKEPKLLTTLYPKERYVIHYRALKQALKHGLRITQIHRILQFNQSAWMKPYIDVNTRMRQQAKNAFEKDFYKLLNNSCFGKTIEDMRKRKIVKLLSKWNGRYGAKVNIANPNFNSRLILGEDLIVVELNKMEVHMIKPLYVGMSILDIAKSQVYEFHYDYMLPKYGSSCKVLYTDTDSLIYNVQCDNIYDDIKKDIHRFDTSDYLTNNPYGIPLVNKKVPGLMKDENCGRILTEFIGLRAKMYSLRVDGVDASKKAKGVKGYVVKQTLTFDDYVKCLRGGGVVIRDQNCIRSLEHKVYTIRQTKVALSPLDNKRRLLLHTTSTLPWGHYSLL